MQAMCPHPTAHAGMCHPSHSTCRYVSPLKQDMQVCVAPHQQMQVWVIIPPTTQSGMSPLPQFMQVCVPLPQHMQVYITPPTAHAAVSPLP